MTLLALASPVAGLAIMLGMQQIEAALFGQDKG